MKIIDNKKDYYDYLMGIYGMDEKIVYDRRGSITYDWFVKEQSQDSLDKMSSMDVKIGNLVYTVLKDKEGKWVCPPEIKLYSWRDDTRPNPITPNEKELKKIFSNAQTGEDLTKEPVAISVYFTRKYWYETCKVFIKKPILATFPAITKVVPAEKVWDEIYNYIASQYDKPIVDTRTDEQKAESAGFDRKTSFRKM